MKKIIMLKLGLMFILVLVLIISCSNAKNELKSKCCQQCNLGAGKDVRGTDISGTNCLDYQDSTIYDSKGEKIEILSSECIDYFNVHSMNVDGCEKQLLSLD